MVKNKLRKPNNAHILKMHVFFFFLCAPKSLSRRPVDFDMTMFCVVVDKHPNFDNSKLFSYRSDNFDLLNLRCLPI